MKAVHWTVAAAALLAVTAVPSLAQTYVAPVGQQRPAIRPTPWGGGTVGMHW